MSNIIIRRVVEDYSSSDSTDESPKSFSPKVKADQNVAAEKILESEVSNQNIVGCNDNSLNAWGREETVTDSNFFDESEYVIEEEVVLEDVEGNFQENENSSATPAQNDKLAEAPTSPSLDSAAAEEAKRSGGKLVKRRFLKYQTSSQSLEPLPEGWVTMAHTSGLHFFFHKKSGVVTWSRPYYVGFATRNFRKHNVPVSSIPCLQYLKVREKLEKFQNSNEKKDEDQPKADTDNPTEVNGVDNSESTPPDSSNLPTALLDSTFNHNLDEKEFETYLEKRFVFGSMQVPIFDTWNQKRAYHKKMKRAAYNKRQNEEAPEQEEGTAQKNVVCQFGSDKIVTISVPRDGAGDRPRKLSYNVAVKPMICILHEYVQLVLKTKPEFVFTCTTSATEPYFIRIVINGKVYGTAFGASKKLCKNKAALKVMDVLVPGFKEKIDKLTNKPAGGGSDYFDDIAVDDPRIYELCLSSGTFLPYELLTECLKRNQKIADVTSEFEAFPGKGKMMEYKLTCGKHVINGTARSKKVGKQIAAQRMLQLLHPQAKTWGELTRLYGSSVADKIKRRQEMEQEILELKQRSSVVRAESPEEGELLPNEEPTSSNVTSARRNDQKRDVLAANPELLAKLKSMMMNLGKEKGLLEIERRKRENERIENEESKKKRRKLLLIDI